MRSASEDRITKSRFTSTNPVTKLTRESATIVDAWSRNPSEYTNDSGTDAAPNAKSKTTDAAALSNVPTRLDMSNAKKRIHVATHTTA